jgi:hypothetical protein
VASLIGFEAICVGLVVVVGVIGCGCESRAWLCCGMAENEALMKAAVGQFVGDGEGSQHQGR